MNVIPVAIFISLIFVMSISGHKIHKRLLETSTNPLSKEDGVKPPNTTTTTLVTTTATNIINKNPIDQNLSLIPSTEAPETLVHPFVEATDVHPFNDSIVFEVIVDEDEKHQPDKTLEPRSKNPATPSGENVALINILSKPLNIVKEDCTCFALRHPSAMRSTQKFENDTTSVISEIESEIGFLFEIASGVLPAKANELIGKHPNESSTNNSHQTSTSSGNSSELNEFANDKSGFFEEIIPFFPLDSFLSRAMPQETIIIQTDSDSIDSSKLFPKMASDDMPKSGSDSDSAADKEKNQKKTERTEKKQIVA